MYIRHSYCCFCITGHAHSRRAMLNDAVNQIINDDSIHSLNGIVVTFYLVKNIVSPTMTKISTVVLLLTVWLSCAHGWSGALSSGITRKTGLIAEPSLPRASLFSRQSSVHLGASSAAVASSEGGESVQLTAAEQKKKKRQEDIRKEGGLFAFNTKYGALNPYGIFYGLTAISLGLVWFVALASCQLFYFITGNRFDRLVSAYCMQIKIAWHEKGNIQLSCSYLFIRFARSKLTNP